MFLFAHKFCSSNIGETNSLFYALGCGCGAFDSPFLCAACDRHWEDHETFFETADERQKNGLPVGKH